MSVLPPYLPTPSARLHAAALRSARPAPWTAWVAALVIALLAALAITLPKVGVALAALAGCLGIGAWILVRPINGLVFALCLFPAYTLLRGVALLYKIPIPLSVVGMWPEAVVMVCLVSIVMDAMRRRERLRLTWDDAPVVVVLAVGVYGVLVSLLQMKLVAAVYGVHYSLSACLFYFVARWARPSQRDVRTILSVLLASYAAIAFVSLLDYVFRPRWVIQIAMVVREGFWKHWDPWVFFAWYPRMQSLLFAEALWGTLSALVSLLCLALLPQVRRRKLVWALFFLSFGCLLLSMSRGALICWAVGVIVLLAVRGRHRLPTAGVCCAVIVVASAGLWALRSHERAQDLIKRTAAITDPGNQLAYDRVTQWERAITIFQLLPAGKGLGAGGNASFYHAGSGLDETIFDGGIFRVLAEQGAPGVLCIVLGLATMAGVLLRRLRGAQRLDRALGLTALAFLAGLSVQNIGQNAFDFPYVPYVLWMLCGLFIARRTAPPEPGEGIAAHAGAIVKRY